MPPVVTPTIYESDKFIDSYKPIIIDNVELHREDIFRLFGKDIDLKSFYISILAILSTILIWSYTGLLKLAISDVFVLSLFALLIVNFIVQIFTSSLFAESLTLAHSRLVSTEQINSMLIGSLLVFIFIIYNTNKNTDMIQLLISVTLLIALINSMNLSVKKEGASIRTVRKIKEVYLNIAIILFASLVYISLKK